MLGSDASAPDRSFDMFRHMFQCMRYHRRHYRDSRVLPPGKVLGMAPIDAAHALGVGGELGSLEPGKKADVITVDTLNPYLTPTMDPLTSIVLYGTSGDISEVVADGSILKREKRLTTINEAEALTRAQGRVEEIIERFFEDYPHQRRNWERRTLRK